MPRFDVHLIRFGPAVAAPAEELRKVFPIDAAQAQAIVVGLPKVVKRNATREVADTIAKALRDLGAEVECTTSERRDEREGSSARGPAATPVAGSLPPPSASGSPPPGKKRRMRATAVAGSFLPSDMLSEPPAAPERTGAEAGSQPEPVETERAAPPKKSPAIPHLTLDFDSLPPKRATPGRRRAGSSAPPARSSPPPAVATPSSFEDDLALPGSGAPRGSSAPPSAPSAFEEQIPQRGTPTSNRPGAPAMAAAGASGALGSIELATDGDAATTPPPLGPAPTTPPVTASRYPAAHARSDASVSERRDVLVAVALLVAIALGIGYRFATHVERPEPMAGDEAGDSLERRLLVGELVDAETFLGGGGEIVTASPSRTNVRGLVNRLIEAGAAKVYAEPETPSGAPKLGGLVVAVAVVVELPGNDDALDPLVAEYAAWSGRLANTISLDELESHGLGPGYWRMRVDLE